MNPPNQISDKKQEANRRNARHSRGPRTEQGKRTSSHNSLRHGFTGRVNILTPENREAHDKFCDELIAGFNPETPMERQFAHSIAEDSWRLNGLRAAETNILAEAAAWSTSETEVAVRTAQAYLEDAKELQLLSLYEQRINRAIHKNLAQLQALQTERTARRHQALEEAKLLTQLDLLNAASVQTSAKTATVAASQSESLPENGQALSPLQSSRSNNVLVSGAGNGQALSPQQPGRSRDILVGGAENGQALSSLPSGRSANLLVSGAENGQALSSLPSGRSANLLVSGAENGQALSSLPSGRSNNLLVSGFVFSSAEVNLAINHDNRLKQARDLASSAPVTPKRLLAVAA